MNDRGFKPGFKGFLFFMLKIYKGHVFTLQRGGDKGEVKIFTPAGHYIRPPDINSVATLKTGGIFGHAFDMFRQNYSGILDMESLPLFS